MQTSALKTPSSNEKYLFPKEEANNLLKALEKNYSSEIPLQPSRLLSPNFQQTVIESIPNETKSRRTSDKSKPIYAPISINAKSRSISVESPPSPPSSALSRSNEDEKDQVKEKIHYFKYQVKQPTTYMRNDHPNFLLELCPQALQSSKFIKNILNKACSKKPNQITKETIYTINSLFAKETSKTSSSNGVINTKNIEELEKAAKYLENKKLHSYCKKYRRQIEHFQEKAMVAWTTKKLPPISAATSSRS